MYLQLPYVADNTFFMVSSCINDGYAHEKHISIYIPNNIGSSTSVH